MTNAAGSAFSARPLLVPDVKTVPLTALAPSVPGVLPLTAARQARGVGRDGEGWQSRSDLTAILLSNSGQPTVV